MGEDGYSKEIGDLQERGFELLQMVVEDDEMAEEHKKLLTFKLARLLKLDAVIGQMGDEQAVYHLHGWSRDIANWREEVTDG